MRNQSISVPIIVWLGGLGWLAGALGRAATAAEAASSKPNVLFIMADDMRPDCIGALGNPHIKTPNLDTLVERGTTFTRAYVLGANTGGVCLPSKTMLLTGRSVFHFREGSPRIGGRGGFAKPEKNASLVEESSVPWAKAMSAGGYETFHLGKPGNSSEFGMKAFDTCLFSTNANSATESEKTADTAIAFLKGRTNQKPFFMYVAPAVPHDPWQDKHQLRHLESSM